MQVRAGLGPARAWLAGIATSALAVLLYAPGTGRDLGYDEALTVGHFVATPSILDPFRRQIAYNNHVLFSFVEHVIHDLDGGWSAVSMRMLPMAAAAATVGLVTFYLVRRLGMLAGLSAGVALVANPGFAFAARTVRGYSLLVLASVVSTILLVSLLRSSEGAPGKRRSIAYVVVVAAGLATHLFMALVVLGHVALVAARDRRSRIWRARWAVGGLLGALAYVGVAGEMLGRAGGGRFFRAGLPGQLARLFFGSPLTAEILIGIVVAAGIVPFIRRVEAKALAAAYLGTFLVLWLVVQPQFLYARFFLWALPAVACAVASAVWMHRSMAILVAAAAIIQVSAQIPHRHENQAPIRLAGRVIEMTDRAGRRACADSETGPALIVVTHSFTTVLRPDQLAVCDVLVSLLPRASLPLLDVARRSYPLVYELPATSPGLVLSRLALDCATKQAGDRTIIVRCGAPVPGRI